MRILSLAVTAALSLGAASARAQSEVVGGAPGGGGVTRAFEINLGLGYNQGFGDVGKQMRTLGDLGAAGGALELGLGYRINPNALIGAYGTLSNFAVGSKTPDTCCVWSGSAGVQANWHFLPANDFDPWVGLGTGWRGYFVNHNNNVGTDAMHGLDLARLQIGVDYKVTKTFAIAPVLGAALSMLLTAQGAQETSFSNIPDPKVNLFIFGGVAGRFDLFGTEETSVRIAAR